jgi:hypothetical protein
VLGILVFVSHSVSSVCRAVTSRLGYEKTRHLSGGWLIMLLSDGFRRLAYYALI